MTISHDDDFYPGEQVLVGSQLGVIDEMTTAARVVIVNDNGLPEERWFPMHMIQKTRKQ